MSDDANRTLKLLTAQVEELQRALEDEQERLLHIQVAVRQMLDEPDVDTNLSDMAEALRALGWRRVIVALLHEKGVIDKLIAAGISADEETAYREGITSESVWALLSNGNLETYRIGGLYFIPVGDGPAWNEHDLLFAPLRLGQGPISGVVRIEEPVNGLRPTRDALRPVDILVSQAAYIVQNHRSSRALQEQVEELSMMHQADRELSTNLDVERVLTLTMDWALRRTNADTGLLMLMSDDRRGLLPSVTIGYLDRKHFPYNLDNPLPLSEGTMGRAARTGETQFVPDVSEDGDSVPFLPNARTQLSVPLTMRGEVLGVITLAASQPDIFAENELNFMHRLARRAAVALDNARLFRQSEQLADDMAVLYSASRTISSTLERTEVLQRIAQGLAVMLECSSAIIYDCRRDDESAQVLAVYQVGTAQGAREVLPEIEQVVQLVSFPAMQTVAENQQPLVLRLADPAISGLDRAHLERDDIFTMALLPLIAQNELIGLAAVIEGRRDRIFTPNEMFKAEALASQASVALRQSMLFGEVLELEKVKSEMIRMASHDLRNPLNNIMGYVELLAMSLSGQTTSDQDAYIDTLRRNTRSMRSLLEDLLTLERIESERQSEWRPVDLVGLVVEVVESQGSSAALKGHTLTLEHVDHAPPVRGSETQLRQAVANLIVNAIKYTPDEGKVHVRLGYGHGRLQFSVQDTGYGIAPERQTRIFERFYRAREPGTDHIGGTGLGLSLVKTVIERHGGQIWFESTPGEGSTFSFWLPAIEPGTSTAGGS